MELYKQRDGGHRYQLNQHKGFIQGLWEPIRHTQDDWLYSSIALDSHIGIESEGSRESSMFVREWQSLLLFWGLGYRIYSRLLQNCNLLSWLLWHHHLGFSNRYLCIIVYRCKLVSYLGYHIPTNGIRARLVWFDFVRMLLGLGSTNLRWC